MGGTFVRAPGDRNPPSTHVLLLDALDEVLVVIGHPSTATTGLLALCRMLARLADAPTAGHVRYESGAGKAKLTVWRQRKPATSLTVDEPTVSPQSPHDWWTTSATRRVMFEALDQRHLAELPLDPNPSRPTILVAGRERPFTDTDSERMATAYRSLLVVARIADGLDGQRIRRLTAGSEPSATCELTAREQEVLGMLSEGLLARSIAQRLQVSERTVHKHLGNLYRKLDAHDRLLAVRRAGLLGLLPSPQVSGW